jgi:hypothetical protein
MKKKLFLAAAIAAFTAVTATSAAQADPVTETIVGSELPNKREWQLLSD